MGEDVDTPRPHWDHWASFRGQGEYSDPTFNINGTRSKLTGYVTDIITDMAVEWLSGRTAEQPFFLAIGHKASHAPFEPPPRHKDLFRDVPMPRPLEDEEITHRNMPLWVARQRHSNQGIELFHGEREFTIHELSVARGRYLRYIATPFAILLILMLIYKAVSHIVLPRIFKQDNLFVARRLGTYTLMLVIALVLTISFFEDLKAIATVMGIVGAAIVIALQDLCSAFAGWFVIVSSGKLKVGDRVEIDGHRGDVIDIQILRTVLLELNNWLEVDEPTDRTIVIPNNFVFKSHVFNYSNVHPYVWGKVDIILTFESDPVAAKELFTKILEEETKEEFEKAQEAGPMMEERYGKRRTEYKPKIHTVVADSGVVFSLHYVTHYTRFADTRDRIMERCAREFHLREDLQFAYPTERHIPTPEGGTLRVQSS